MVVLAPHGEVAKTLPVVRLATHKLFVSVDAVVGVELLATNLAGKHMFTVLPNFVLESFVTYITGVNPLSLSCTLSPYFALIPCSNNVISSQTCPQHL